MYAIHHILKSKFPPDKKKIIYQNQFLRNTILLIVFFTCLVIFKTLGKTYVYHFIFYVFSHTKNIVNLVNTRRMR